MTPLMVEVSPGELWDRITILEIRMDHVKNPEKSAILRTQISKLRNVWGDSTLSARVTGNFTRLIRELRDCNETGWRLEDEARLGVDELTSEAFRNNDKRNLLKREIDAEFDHDAADEKIHGGGA